MEAFVWRQKRDQVHDDGAHYPHDRLVKGKTSAAGGGEGGGRGGLYTQGWRCKERAGGGGYLP